MSTTHTKAEAGSKRQRTEAAGTAAQEQCMAEPQAEHHWLDKLVGEWAFEGEGVMEPDKPPMKWEGTENVRSIGGLWIVAEGEGEMPGGGPATTIMTLGYDPQKGRYVGTFIGSMMPHMWLYEGELDAKQKVLTLHTEGPNMAAEGSMAPFKDVIEIKSDDHRILTSHMQDDEGNWRQFMTAHYHRKK
jgi:hypothetical protein